MRMGDLSSFFPSSGCSLCCGFIRGWWHRSRFLTGKDNFCQSLSSQDIFFNKAYLRETLKCVLLVICGFQIRGQGGFSNSRVFFFQRRIRAPQISREGSFCFVFLGHLSHAPFLQKLTGRGGFLVKANSNKKFKRRRRRFSYLFFYSLPFKFPQSHGNHPKKENPTSLTREHRSSNLAIGRKSVKWDGNCLKERKEKKEAKSVQRTSYPPMYLNT
ncbi:hypothetical protein F4775DRAFT_248489 [Biscogniauxia sp. FL1348]|nr:hypothetical protein F4775DRAFT_248489 [Biscogniauxia sp. FL1348]